MRRLFPLFLDPNSPPGGGGAPSLTDDQIKAKVEQFLQRQGGGDPMKAVEILLADNADLRTKNRSLRENLDQQKAFVVSGDEAKLLTEFKKLGVPLDTLVKERQELTTLRETLNKNSFKDLVTTAAKAHGWNPEVLEDQVSLRKMHVEMKDVHVKNGDKTEVRKVPYVRPAGDANAPLQSAEEWVATLPKPYQAALKDVAQAPGGSAQTPVSVVQYPSQTPASGQGSSGRLVDNHLKSTYVLPGEKPAVQTLTATQGA